MTGTSYQPPLNTASCVVSSHQVNLTAAGTLSITNPTYTDFSDGTTTMSVTFTPGSSSNRLLIYGWVSIIGSTSGVIMCQLVQDGTPIVVGTSVGSRVACSFASDLEALYTTDNATMINFSYMVTSGTSSSTTIKIQITAAASKTIYVNRGVTDTNSSSFCRYSSQMNIVEFNN